MLVKTYGSVLGVMSTPVQQPPKSEGACVRAPVAKEGPPIVVPSRIRDDTESLSVRAPSTDEVRCLLLFVHDRHDAVDEERS